MWPTKWRELVFLPISFVEGGTAACRTCTISCACSMWWQRNQGWCVCLKVCLDFVNKSMRPIWKCRCIPRLVTETPAGMQGPASGYVDCYTGSAQQTLHQQYVVDLRISLSVITFLCLGMVLLCFASKSQIIAGIYNSSRLHHIVLDEADTLLDDSFSPLTLRLLQKFKVEKPLNLEHHCSNEIQLCSNSKS